MTKAMTDRIGKAVSKKLGYAATAKVEENYIIVTVVRESGATAGFGIPLQESENYEAHVVAILLAHIKLVADAGKQMERERFFSVPLGEVYPRLRNEHGLAESAVDDLGFDEVIALLGEPRPVRTY